MTVKELIQLLQTMPEDAEVIYQLFSDVESMREDEVKLITPESNIKVVKRNGRYETYKAHWWTKANMNPEFVTVVKFPGN